MTYYVTGIYARFLLVAPWGAFVGLYMSLWRGFSLLTGFVLFSSPLLFSSPGAVVAVSSLAISRGWRIRGLGEG